MQPCHVNVLRIATAVVWTMGVVALILGVAYTGPNIRLALAFYQLSVTLVTVGGVLSVWLISNSIVTRAADRVRDEIADAVGIAMRDHMDEQQPPRLKVARH